MPNSITYNVSTQSLALKKGYLLGISKFNSSFSAYPLNGWLAILRIYKGVGLTSTQVLQNYNSTKARFGL